MLSAKALVRWKMGVSWSGGSPQGAIVMSPMGLMFSKPLVWVMRSMRESRWEGVFSQSVRSSPDFEVSPDMLTWMKVEIGDLRLEIWLLSRRAILGRSRAWKYCA